MAGLFGLGGAEHLQVWRNYFGDLREWGVDCDGLFMRLSGYGKGPQYGWQIDHIVASALGGPDTFANKRPRHRVGNSLAGAMVGNALRRGLS